MPDNTSIAFTSDTMFESTASIVCLEGYQLSDGSRTANITCTENGTWSEVASCKRKERIGYASLVGSELRAMFSARLAYPIVPILCVFNEREKANCYLYKTLFN